jgi:hypothetical protein
VNSWKKSKALQVQKELLEFSTGDSNGIQVNS